MAAFESSEAPLPLPTTQVPCLNIFNRYAVAPSRTSRASSETIELDFGPVAPPVDEFLQGYAGFIVQLTGQERIAFVLDLCTSVEVPQDPASVIILATSKTGQESDKSALFHIEERQYSDHNKDEVQFHLNLALLQDDSEHTLFPDYEDVSR